jgi:hypothetical protein
MLEVEIMQHAQWVARGAARPPPQESGSMTLDEKKAVVTTFLSRCTSSAADRIASHQAELASATTWQSLAIQDKIGHWTAYRAFNEYTIEELSTQELDQWFDETSAP